MSRAIAAMLAAGCALLAAACFMVAGWYLAEAAALMQPGTSPACCCTTDTDCALRCGGTGDPE